MATVILEFRGPYRFLSNVWPAAVLIDGICYPTAEHAYQAQKTLDPVARRAVAQCRTPADAKRHGRALSLRYDWDNARVSAMRAVIRAKFDPALHSDLCASLVATIPAVLCEGNNWNDTFWGVDLATGYGQNWLGRLLMERRSALIVERLEPLP